MKKQLIRPKRMSCFSLCVDNIRPERHQRKLGQLEALQANRNADNGDAPQAAGKKPSKSTDESAEDDPEYISYKSHFLSPLSAAFLPFLN